VGSGVFELAPLSRGAHRAVLWTAWVSVGREEKMGAPLSPNPSRPAGGQLCRPQRGAKLDETLARP